MLHRDIQNWSVRVSANVYLSINLRFPHEIDSDCGYFNCEKRPLHKKDNLGNLDKDKICIFPDNTKYSSGNVCHRIAVNHSDIGCIDQVRCDWLAEVSIRQIWHSKHD